MKGKSLPNLALPLLLLGCLCIAAAAHAGPAVYLDAFGKLVAVDHPAATNPVSALNVLADGPPGPLAAMGVSSAIPRGKYIASGEQRRALKRYSPVPTRRIALCKVFAAHRPVYLRCIQVLR